MAEPSIIRSIPIDHVPLCDEFGRVWWIDAITYAAWLDRGLTEICPHLTLKPIRPTVTIQDLRLAQAARLLMSDVDNLSQRQAEDRIRYAIRQKTVLASGTSRSLRIDPNSFAAWRLEQRERNLNSLDE